MALTTTAPLSGASMRTALTRFFSRAFWLRGRASRSEYWWWMLVNFVILTVTQLVLPAVLLGRVPTGTISVGPFGSWPLAPIELITWTGTDDMSSPVLPAILFIASAWILLTAIPGFTVAVRRLHDSNLSGWWILVVFIPAGPIILLLLELRRSRVEGLRFD